MAPLTLNPICAHIVEFDPHHLILGEAIEHAYAFGYALRKPQSVT